MTVVSNLFGAFGSNIFGWYNNNMTVESNRYFISSLARGSGGSGIKIVLSDYILH